MTIFVDANFFMRALTNATTPEVEQMAVVAQALFIRANQGEVELFTSDAVIAEVAFVLTSKTVYALTVNDAAGRIAALLRSHGIKMANKSIVLDALQIWDLKPTLGFVDALAAAHGRQPGMALAPFDKSLRRVSGVTVWVEPTDR